MRLSAFLQRHRIPLLLFIGSLCVYCLFAWERLGKPSTDPHFVYLAEAYLAGSLELQRKPPHRNDWASWRELELADGRRVRGVWRTSKRGDSARQFRTLEGPVLALTEKDVRKTTVRYFVSFPPLPALLMLPFVALFGLKTNDVLLTAIVAALNVVLIHAVLRRLGKVGQSERSARDDLILALVFGFGTVHLWCSVVGQVWFTALVVGVAFTCGFLLAVEAERPWVAGVMLACALATRTPLAFLCVYYPLRLAWDGERWDLTELRSKATTLAKAALPAVLMLAILFTQNWIRFRNPFEFGHSYLAGGTIPRIAWHGLFSPRFVPKHLVAALLLLPAIKATPPFLIVSRHGLSMLLTSPVFLWLLRPLRTPASHRALWVTALVVAIPALFYQNTGYEQFGYRFSLDYTPLLIALLAVGGRPLGRAFLVAAAAGVLVNAYGGVTFKRFQGHFDDHFPLEHAL